MDALASSYRDEPREETMEEKADVSQERDAGLKHPVKREKVRCAM